MLPNNSTGDDENVMVLVSSSQMPWVVFSVATDAALMHNQEVTISCSQRMNHPTAFPLQLR